MTRALSMDLRERAMARLEKGETCRQVAATPQVGVTSVVKWSRRKRDTGSCAPKKPPGPKPYVLKETQRDYIRKRLRDEPHAMLRAIQIELAELGTKVSYGAIWNFVHADGLSFKKTAIADERLRPDVVRRRKRWRSIQTWIDPDRLVFIDETWVKTNMAPLRGWSARGKRLNGYAPHRQWKTSTFLAGLRRHAITAPFVFEGPINGEIFKTYVADVLVPTLRPGDIVVMDNLGSHKGRAIRELVRKAGARVWFLPPYSPDLNPIEQVFAKLKHMLRKAQERTSERAWDRIGQLLKTFSPEECANYVANSGYRFNEN
ncbi:MAG: IS630 family transposase [Hyphomonadaceae bacterium]|nr:IS630 family transposase [Hyphomonadaceae bacterium]